MKHYIVGDEFGVDFVKKVIDDAIEMKKDTSKIPNLSGKSALFLFFNKSLRTRLSFSYGAQKMGMNTMCEDIDGMYAFETKDVEKMNGDKPEHVKEAAKVMSRYVDLIGIRNSAFIGGNDGKGVNIESLLADEFINTFAKYSRSPIVNMESDMYHPMQGLADVMTIKEKLKTLEGKKIVVTWVPHIKHLPIATPQSQLLTPAIMGANVVLACPNGFELSEHCMSKVEKYAGSCKVENNQEEALKNADVVIAKSWLSLKSLENGFKVFGDDYYNAHASWMLDSKKMSLTNNALFMHCLPMRRGVEVTNEVVDSNNSVIIDEAENRMWAQMSLMDSLLKKSY